MCVIRHGLDSGIGMMERLNCEIGGIALSLKQWEGLKKEMEHICVYSDEEKGKLSVHLKDQVGTYRGYPVFLSKDSLMKEGYISSKDDQKSPY